MVPLSNEQVVVERIKLLRREGLSFAKLARRLNEEQAPARRNGKWKTGRVCIIPEREGLHTMRRNRPRIPTRFDPKAAMAKARKLREEGLSLNQIGVRLLTEGLTPLRGSTSSGVASGGKDAQGNRRAVDDGKVSDERGRDLASGDGEYPAPVGKWVRKGE